MPTCACVGNAATAGRVTRRGDFAGPVRAPPLGACSLPVLSTLLTLSLCGLLPRPDHASCQVMNHGLCQVVVDGDRCDPRWQARVERLGAESSPHQNAGTAGVKG